MSVHRRCLLDHYEGQRGDNKTMKDNKTKLEFIKARAEGKSYRTISKELGISISTCSEWENFLADQIAQAKKEELDELYSSYNMTKQARIKELGELIERIDEARGNIADKPLETLSEDRLIELKLKVMKELQAEYKEPVATSDNTLDGLLEEYNRIYSESRSGKLTASETKAQLSILDGKRDLLYRIAVEETREEKEGSIDLELGYTSKLLRHPEDEAI